MALFRKEKEISEIYPAEDFATSSLFCPECHANIKEPVKHCPRCGYSGQSAVKKFPFEAPAISRYMDPDQHLSEADRKTIDGGLKELAKRFSQPRFCFCLVDLDKSTDLREFGFWLLNASPLTSAEEEKLRPWTILVLIDDTNARASITTGYAIEPFLNEDRWASLLLLERSYFLSRSYGAAISKFVDGAIGVLSEGAERTERRLTYRRMDNRYPDRSWK